MLHRSGDDDPVSGNPSRWIGDGSNGIETANSFTRSKTPRPECHLLAGFRRGRAPRTDRRDI